MQLSDDFSIRMSSADSLAPPADLFATRPDRKGPKTIGLLLVVGSIMMILAAYGDISLANTDQLSQEELDALLTNVREANNQNITDEEYQEFHDEARDSGAYSLRGWSVLVGGLAVAVGGIQIFRLKSIGVKLALGGATIAAIGGVYANYMIYNISVDMLPDALILANKISGYLCGICMVVCAATSALPILNASARAALDQKVELFVEDE